MGLGRDVLGGCSHNVFKAEDRRDRGGGREASGVKEVLAGGGVGGGFGNPSGEGVGGWASGGREGGGDRDMVRELGTGVGQVPGNSSEGLEVKEEGSGDGGVAAVKAGEAGGGSMGGFVLM